MKQKLREWAFRALYTLACKLSNATVWLFGRCYAWFPEYMMFAERDAWDDTDLSEEDGVDEDEPFVPHEYEPDLFDQWEENELQIHLKEQERYDAQKRTYLPM